MKVIRAKCRVGMRRNPNGGQAETDRDGSILVAVLWLLALLWVIGIFFFLFANTEQTAAQYYADAAKVDRPLGVNPDVLWEWTLRQLIVGPKFDEDQDGDPAIGDLDSEQQSALYSFDSRMNSNLGRHSMLYHVLGNDLQRYNGEGIHVIADATNPGMPLVDQDYDGVNDALELLDFNYSSVAEATGLAQDVAGLTDPPPATDVGYTYPDANALFLAVNIPPGPGPDGILGTGDDTPRIIKPSFHMPAYLRELGPPVAGITGWDTDPTVIGRVFRAHSNHLGDDGTTSKYLTAQTTNAQGATVTAFPFTTTDGSNTIVMQEGVWTNDPTYDYDADPDGDGIEEAVLLDLDFPVQSSGSIQFKPMFAITVYDADGLLNLNAIGNTSGTRITNLIDPRLPDPLNPLSTIRFSQSNQGLSPAELSLRYALRADPTLVADPAFPATSPWTPYQAIFDIDPAVDFTGTPEQNQDVLANMETFMLLHGGGAYDEPADGTYDFQNPLLGRYGDRNLLEDPNNPGAGALETTPANTDPTVYPQPGVAADPLVPGSGDDDGDTNKGELDPAYGHPLDFLGVGTYVNTDGFTPVTIGTAAPGDPNRWIQYDGYSSNGGVTYNLDVANLMLDLTSAPGGVLDANIDEGDETVLLSGYSALSSNDATFGVGEMAGLHKSDSDPDANLILSRLKNLLSINFKEASNAAEIRKQFTTIGWDRVDFGLGQTVTRRWEWSDGFPPQGPVSGDPPLTGQQPLRQPLFDLLAIDSTATDPNNTGLQRKLDLNRHLVGTDTDGTPLYDELTQYSVDPVQARKDRQEKARDIYVLLYLFGGGVDGAGPDGVAGTADDWVGADGVFGSVGDDDGNGIDDDISEYGWAGSDDQSYLSSNAGNSIYTAEQMRQMAQFAVNVVDALDEDNVMTEFEYDVDLGNGWNLDDDPHTNNQPAEADRATRTVYGVEEQQLTFSEVVAIEALGLASDHPATRYDDSFGGDRKYVFVELRNASTRSVDLVVGPSQPGWQIVYSPTYSAATANDPAEANLETNLAAQEIIQIHPTAGAPLDSREVAPGELYTIGTSGGKDFDAVNMEQRPSDFVVDWNLDGFTDRDLIVPRPSNPTNAALTDPSNPSVDLDLSHPDHNGYGTTTDGNGNLLPLITSGPGPAPQFHGKGAFLESVTSGQQPWLHLRRLANPDLPFNSVSNRWVIVDRIQFTVSSFGLTALDNASDVPGRVATILSDERPQPLYRTDFTGSQHSAGDIDGPADDGIGGTVGNSIDAINEKTMNAPLNGAFTLWQPHFNRHFASVMELLSVPIFPPEKLTNEIVVVEPIGSAPKLGIPTVQSLARDGLAQEKFLFPEYNDGVTPPSAMLDNRWYRLFEFVEVPSQMHQNSQIAEIDRDRVPGDINLNTMRHPGVLGGIIDDPTMHDINLLDQQEGASRSWWNEFIAARDAVIFPNGNPANGGDGKDPVTSQYVPGVAGTRPFRDFTHVDSGNLSIDHTLFRSLPSSANFSDQQVRRLFEIGTAAQHTNNNVDYYTRNRLLSKVMNHSTTRSHVFIVYVAVEFYEVVEATDGQPQIGGKLVDAPEHRGFFIVDLSKPLEGYSPPSSTPRGTFDFRKYVRYRRTIK